jgi:hypothetical protein
VVAVYQRMAAVWTPTAPQSLAGLEQDIAALVAMGFSRDDCEVAYAMFDRSMEACTTYLLGERERMMGGGAYGDF